MTLEEAQKVARVCETADGGCPHCVENICNELIEAFPEFAWSYNEDVSIHIMPSERSGESTFMND